MIYYSIWAAFEFKQSIINASPMDYLDRKKTYRNNVILLVGYVLIMLAIVVSALVLLYEAYGFGLGKNGSVIQSGLVFFSSQPNPANIYVNGKLNSSSTNSRLSLEANIYQIKLTKSGYRDWNRTINITGGSVVHYDYPFLFPVKLANKQIKSMSSAPGITAQSPSRRWLVVEQPGSMTDFLMYDLTDITKAPVSISLPANILTKATSSESWHYLEWADDNQHLLLKHTYDDKSEFILVDTNNPTQSVNLNTTLSNNPSAITLNNKKYDQYYLYDAGAKTLQTATLNPATVTPKLNNVLAYKSYGNDTILYATSENAPAGKVLVKQVTGTNSTDLRTLPAGDNYLVDLTQYQHTMYVALSAANSGKVYIYRDPVSQITNQPKHAIVPIQVLHLNQPNNLTFSANAQFIMAENGTRFGVYDIQNKLTYNYQSMATMDSPQTIATWMDGDRLTYVSGGKLYVADYDNANPQILMSSDPHYLPAFSPDFKFVYNIAASNSANQFNLNQSSLLAQ